MKIHQIQGFSEKFDFCKPLKFCSYLYDKILSETLTEISFLELFFKIITLNILPIESKTKTK